MNRRLTKSMMNYKLWACGLWLLAACSGDSPNTSGLPPIRLTTGADVSVESTRGPVVIGTLLPKDDRVGIFAYSYTGTDSVWQSTPDIWENEPATVGDADGGARSPLTMDNEVFYTDDKHAFYAYYPYINGITAADPLIEGDLFETTAGDTDGQIDWMRSDPVIGQTATDSPVRLVFRHLTAMLWVKAGKIPSLTASVALEQIGIATRQSQKFEYNLSDGTFTRVAGGTKTMNIVPEPNIDATRHLIGALADIDAAPTITAAKIVAVPLSEVVKMTFLIEGKNFETPDDWGGIELAEAGKYATIYLVVENDRVTMAIGHLDYIDGENTTIALRQTRFNIGDSEWEDDDDDTTIALQESELAIGETEWQTEEIDVTEATR